MDARVKIRLLEDLERRRVLRTAVTYAAAAFVAAKGAAVALHALGAPEQALTAVPALLVAGLPLVLLLAWLFDLTPDGVVLTPPARVWTGEARADAAGARRRAAGAVLAGAVVVLLTVALWTALRPEPGTGPRGAPVGEVPAAGVPL